MFEGSSISGLEVGFRFWGMCLVFVAVDFAENILKHLNAVLTTVQCHKPQES